MALTYLGVLTPPTVSESFWNGSSWSTPTISSGYSSCSLGIRQGIDPVETGNWDRKTLRINNVLIKRETRAESPCFIDFKPHVSWGIRFSGHINAAYWMNPEVFLPSSLTFSGSKSDFISQKTLAKLSTADFDAGTNLGELRETLAMLRSPLKGIREFLVKSGKRSGESKKVFLARLADSTSSTWLEYRYGIRPLISAVEDLLKLYREGFTDVNLNKLYRKKSRYKSSIGDVTNTRLSFSSWVGDRVTVSKAEESYNAGIFYRYTRLPTAYEHLGLDWASLPSIAWELLLLSFVWDWFFGIGNWIASLRAEYGRAIAGAYVSHKVVHTTETSLIPESLYVSGQPSWRPLNTYSNKLYTKIELLDRRAVSLTGFSLPAYNPNSLGFLRQLDSLSLLWQRLPRG